MEDIQHYKPTHRPVQPPTSEFRILWKDQLPVIPLNRKILLLGAAKSDNTFFTVVLPPPIDISEF